MRRFTTWLLVCCILLITGCGADPGSSDTPLPTGADPGTPVPLQAGGSTAPNGAPGPLGTSGHTACTPYPPPSSTLRYYINGANPFPYVSDTDASGNVTAIYPATFQLTHATQSLGGTGCSILNQANVFAYTLGAAVPLTDFVEMQTITE